MPPLRDIFLTGFIFYLVPYCYTQPWIGVLMWSWLTYMSPHKQTWGFARDMPFALIVAIAVILGVLTSRDKLRRALPKTRETSLLIALCFDYTFTTILAWYPGDAWDLWFKLFKILLFTFFTLLYFQDRQRLRYLFLIIGLSIGFYGLKGGIWVFTSGNPGAGSVLGPEGGSLLSGNNGIGLALCMTMPFLLFLGREEPRRWLRRILFAMLIFSPIAIIFTFSRTSMLTLPVVLIMLFMRARRRILGFFALAIFAYGIMNYAPERLFERAGSIQEHTDRSSQMRMESWYVSWRFALDHPLTGGGFWILDHEPVYDMYLSEYIRAQSAHNIYLEVLADHGFPGLILYVSLTLSSYFSLFQLKWALRNKPEAEWLVNYCKMIQVSLAAFIIGGTFLPMSYWDYFYHLVSFVILLQAIAVKEGLLSPAAARSPAPIALRRPVVVSRV